MRLEPLGNGVEVYVSDTHRFSTDTILLGHFAAVKNSERVVELGTGCGTIPLLMIREHAPKGITAIDIQEEAVDLLTKSIAHNQHKGIERAGLIQPVLGDIRNVREYLPAGESDRSSVTRRISSGAQVSSIPIRRKLSHGMKRNVRWTIFVRQPNGSYGLAAGLFFVNVPKG